MSLIASATEIVCELGFGEQLVGRSHECDFPPFVRNLPVCTRPKFDPDGRSYEIDARVRAIVEEALSVYWVDSKLLDELKPTHIITQSHCEVCAVSLKDVEEAVCKLTSSKPVLVSLEPNRLSDLWTGITSVACALGDGKRAEKVIERLQRQMESIENQTRLLRVRPTVAFIEWIEPLMAGGNWMPELIEMAGGANRFGEAGKHSPVMSFEAVVQENPDVLVIAPCGWDIERTLEDLELLARKPGWEKLRAVESSRVFVADGNQFFNRPGPRLLESLQILAEILHPDLFHFGHEGKGWTRWKINHVIPRPQTSDSSL